MIPPTEEEIANLRANLRRCSPETVEAAVRFRTTHDVKEIPTVVYGIIERHLAPEHTRSLADASDDTRLIEDLGIDSLTLLEIVLSIEETVGISIENEELREIRTLGEVKQFIARKLTSGPEQEAAASTKVRPYNRVEIATVLPQQPPFLFVDEAEIEGNIVRAKYTVQGSEAFLEGHFKDNPVMPASLVFEAIGQAACLWVLECAPGQLQSDIKSHEVLFASMEEAHFYRRAKPGDTLELEAESIRLRPPLAIFRGRATLRGERLAQIEHLVLAFGQEVVEHLDRHETDASENGVAAGEAGSGQGSAAPPAPASLAETSPAADSPFADATTPVRPVGDDPGQP